MVMLASPGKPKVPDFGDTYDGGRMRELAQIIDSWFARIKVNGPLIIGGGRTITKHFSETVTWDPGNLLNNTQTTKTVAVTGVLLADANTVSCGFSKSLQGMQLTAYVSADDVVTVVLRNGTGGAIDLASGNLTVDVWRHG